MNQCRANEFGFRHARLFCQSGKRFVFFRSECRLNGVWTLATHMPPRKAERIGEATDSKTNMRLLSFLGATDVAPIFEVTPSLPLEK